MIFPETLSTVVKFCIGYWLIALSTRDWMKMC